jgi:hypothetical protein
MDDPVLLLPELAEMEDRALPGGNPSAVAAGGQSRQSVERCCAVGSLPHSPNGRVAPRVLMRLFPILTQKPVCEQYCVREACDPKQNCGVDKC